VEEGIKKTERGGGAKKGEGTGKTPFVREAGEVLN